MTLPGTGHGRIRRSADGFDPTRRPLLKDLGVSAAKLLRRAELPEDLLTRPSVRLDFVALARMGTRERVQPLHQEHDRHA